jgi:hypothetical protein
MDLKSGSSHDSITTIHEIGRDWGHLPHREPFHLRRLRDRRKDRGTFDEQQRGRKGTAEEGQNEVNELTGEREGFEIVV